MFKKFIDDGETINVVADPRNPRLDHTNPPVDQVNANPGLAGFVEFCSHPPVNQAVHLDDGPGFLSFFSTLNFFVQLFNEKLSYVEW